MSYVPLSSEGHIGAMTDGMPSMQMPVAISTTCKYKSHCKVGARWFAQKGYIVGLKALLFNFEELLLLNVATADEPTHDPPLTEVDLQQH